MAWSIQKDHATGKPEIVINGFQAGIADSPYEGIADMRNVNIISQPGEAAVNFKTQAMIAPPAVNAASFTVVAATDIFTVTSTTGYFKGMAIVLNTTSAGGTSTGVVYYIGSISGNTFKIYTNVSDAINAGTPVNVSSDGSGTLTTYQVAKANDKCVDGGQAFATISTGVPSVASYIIDTKNQVWLLIPYTTTGSFTPGTMIFLGNIGSTVTAASNSICVWKGYLFVFRFGAVDYWNMSLSTAPASAWTYSWAALTPTSVTSLKSFVDQDDTLYFCNGSQIGSLLEKPNQTFNPASATTYTANTAALLLPNLDYATCIAQLGQTLLVGGSRNLIYPWDRTSPGYNPVLIVPERYISNIVSTNSNAYIFAGSRGYIYITNGANVDRYKKIPDSLSGVPTPYYLNGGVGSVNSTAASGAPGRGDAIYWRNQLYFSLIARNNAGTDLDNMAGVWAIDLSSGALRLVQKMSYGTYAGRVPVIVPDMSTITPGGEGLFCGWVDGSNNFSIDNTVNTPYSSFETYIDTDIMNVGSFYSRRNFTKIEFKLSRQLVSGESIRIYWRSNLNGTFTLLSTASTTGIISAPFGADLKNVQWLQLRVEYSSTSSSPSYVPLTELRIKS